MEIIDFCNKYIIEIITIIYIIIFLFGGKLHAKVGPSSGKLGDSKLNKKDLAYGNLYKNISALGYAAKNNTLDKELQSLKVYFLENKEYFSHEIENIYHDIFDRFYSFEAWKLDTQKSIKISEQNSISMNKLEDLIISETNYTKYTFDNSIKGHY